jgi:iron(III) transport system permease protein
MLRRSRNTVVLFLRTPQQWLGWLLLVVFGYLIVVPVGQMVLATFQVQRGDTRRADGVVGEWTLYYWERILTGPISDALFYRPLYNTILVSFSYTLLAMALGMVFAWLLVRTNLPYKKVIGTAILVPYIIPSWSIALAWLTLFGNHRVGIGAPGFVQSIFGIVPADWLVYGPLPIVLILAINYFAFTFLLTAAALSSLDASLEESAILHGAHEMTILRRITLPLLLPALGSAFILTFAQGLGTFGVPAILGIPARFNVLATSLYQSIGGGRMGDGLALTLVLVAVAGLTIYMNSLLLGKRKQFTAITGRGASHRRVDLGRYRVPVLIAVLMFLFFVAVVPIILLLWRSLQLQLGDFSFSNLTLTYWIGHIDAFDGILVDPRVQNAAWNTVRLGLAVAGATAIIGIFSGYVVSKARGTKLAQLVEQLVFLPYVIPGIAFGAIYLMMFSRPHGPLPVLYGTIWILILAAVVNRLPFASRTGITAMMQLDRSLEEAGEVHGATFGTRLRRIILPLTRKGFLAGFILSFVNTVKDLSLVIMLVSPQTMVLTALTFGYIEIGRRQFADALALVILVMALGATWLAQWLTKTDPLEGFGGGRDK